MKKAGKLAGILIALSISLILYCAAFFTECFLENAREKNTYETMRNMCIQVEDSDVSTGASAEADLKKQDKKKKRTRPTAEKTTEILRESFGISWEDLRKISPKIIGWIEVPGADISYPILQGTDDEYYLHHAPDGTESSFGSIFLGTDHDADFLDSHSLVYGHNMEGGMMFANLNKYEKADFYRQCPLFFIVTPKRRFTYEIFSVEQADPESACYLYGYERRSGAYKRQLADLKANSAYDTGVEPDNRGTVVTLITCNSRLDANIRTAIHGICRNIEVAGEEE